MLYDILAGLMFLSLLFAIIMQVLTIIIVMEKRSYHVSAPKKITRNTVKAAKKISESVEVQKYRNLMENIENFDGTSLGQKEL